MKYSGKIGIAVQTEVNPGAWEEAITEHEVLGEMRQRSETLESVDSVLPRYATTTSVSLLARAIGDVDNSSIRYVTKAGKRWAVTSIVEEFPNIATTRFVICSS